MAKKRKSKTANGSSGSSGSTAVADSSESFDTSGTQLYATQQRINEIRAAAASMNETGRTIIRGTAAIDNTPSHTIRGTAGGDSSEQAAAPLPGAGSTAALLGIPGARSFELRCKPRLSPSGAAQPTILVGQGRAACPRCHGRDAAQADTDTRVVQYRLTPPSPRTTFSTYEMSLHVTGVPGVTGVPNDTPTAPEEVHVIVKWNDKTFNVPLREVSMLFEVITESIDHVFRCGDANGWVRD